MGRFCHFHHESARPLLTRTTKVHYIERWDSADYDNNGGVEVEPPYSISNSLRRCKCRRGMPWNKLHGYDYWTSTYVYLRSSFMFTFICTLTRFSPGWLCRKPRQTVLTLETIQLIIIQNGQIHLTPSIHRGIGFSSGLSLKWKELNQHHRPVNTVQQLRLPCSSSCREHHHFVLYNPAKVNGDFMAIRPRLERWWRGAK